MQRPALAARRSQMPMASGGRHLGSRSRAQGVVFPPRLAGAVPACRCGRGAGRDVCGLLNALPRLRGVSAGHAGDASLATPQPGAALHGATEEGGAAGVGAGVGAGETVVAEGMKVGDPTLLHALWWGFGRWLHGDWLSQEAAGLDHLPLDSGCFLVASNHQSHLDCSALYTAAWSGGAKRVYALGARDYFFRSPLMALFVTALMRVVPISRKGFTEKDLVTLHQVVRSSSPSNPTAVVIFPEGTRSTTGRCGRFKVGVGYLAAALGVPVVPAYVSGTHDALPKNRYVPRRRRVRISFAPPMRPEQFLSSKEGVCVPGDVKEGVPGDVAAGAELGGGGGVGGGGGSTVWDSLDAGEKKSALNLFAEALRGAVVAMQEAGAEGERIGGRVGVVSAVLVWLLTVATAVLWAAESALRRAAAAVPRRSRRQ